MTTMLGTMPYNDRLKRQIKLPDVAGKRDAHIMYTWKRSWAADLL